MKKRNVIISCAVICTIVSAILVLILHKSTSDSIEVKPFMLNQYRRELSSFSTDKQVGKIVDERDVLEKAERIFLETFGDDVLKEKPFNLYFDQENKVWLVTGSCPSGSRYKGGVAYLLVSEEGHVLAVWHEE